MIGRGRKYRTGTRWCLWRWSDVDSGYIVRLHLVKTPWLAICLHWILKPDPEPYLHDHPVTFLSLFLRGGYTEKRWRAGDRYDRLVRHRWFNYLRATPDDRHTIVTVRPHTLTLALMGPKRREWGFHIPDDPVEGKPPAWIYWRDYYKLKRQGVQP